QAMMEVNKEHVIAYGDDEVTRKAQKQFKQWFGEDTEVFFVFNGTGANTISIASATRPFHAVVCADTAHINVDECGAPEKFSGCKLISIPTTNGKLTPELVKPHLHGFGFEHHSQPGMISITQVTEMGTLYTIDEIKALADLAHEHTMFLHMDGARIANAAVALNKEFVEFTKNAGVDILSFGGTKNGMMYGEAIVYFRPELVPDVKFFRKQAMQLASKMRYISAQFLAYFEDDLWKKSAAHANKMAAKLYESVAKIPQIKVTQAVQANGVFAIVPPEIIEPLQEAYFFYMWDENKSEVRWMTSFDTTEEDIDGFVKKLKELL
ncbi:MAG: threonine aldolase family protein, partial [Mariniphaga sp.]